MKILHIIAGMPPESGVAAVVKRLAVEQRGLAHQVSLATTQDNTVLKFESSKVLKLERENIEHRTSNIEHRTGVREVVFARSWPRAVYFSWEMLLGLGKEIKEADVVHVHSSWTFPVWWGAWLALRHQKTLVMSPHGALDPVRLKHSAWKKRLVGWMDRWLLRRASVIVATCGDEKRWIQAFLECANARMRECENGTPRQGAAHPGGAVPVPGPKIVVVPNGVGIPAPGRGTP